MRSIVALKAALAQGLWSRYPRLWLRYSLAFSRDHFESEYWFVPLFCRKDHIAIDVGANMGIYSYLMQRHSKSVVSFEPNTDLWPHLHRLLGKNVRLEGAALSNRTGTASFRYIESNTGLATIEEKNKLPVLSASQLLRVRNIEVRTLDSYRFADVSFIKIDVEGHEEAVIEGAGELLKDYRPVLLIETENRHNPGAPKRLIDRLGNFGYAAFYLKSGRLRDARQIDDADCDPANASRVGHRYVNNFLFIPSDQTDLIAAANALASRLQD